MQDKSGFMSPHEPALKGGVIIVCMVLPKPFTVRPSKEGI